MKGDLYDEKDPEQNDYPPTYDFEPVPEASMHFFVVFRNFKSPLSVTKRAILTVQMKALLIIMQLWKKDQLTLKPNLNLVVSFLLMMPSLMVL